MSHAAANSRDTEADGVDAGEAAAPWSARACDVATVDDVLIAPRRRRRGLVCGGCGYDLRGLPAGGACPECATAVSDSLGGRPIRAAEARWAATVGAGAVVAGLAVALWPLGVLAVLIGVVSGLVGGDSLLSILWWRWPWAVGSLVVAELALGWWFVTTPERRGDGEAVSGPEGGRLRRRRRAARFAGVAAAALVVGATALSFAGQASVEAALRSVFGGAGGGLARVGWATLVLAGVGAAASFLLVLAHVIVLGEAARLAGRAGRWSLGDRLLALRRAPLLIAAFWVGAIMLTPIVALIDLIIGLLVMIYLTAVNLLMPSLVVGSVMLSGAALVKLGRALPEAARAAPHATTREARTASDGAASRSAR